MVILSGIYNYSNGIIEINDGEIISVGSKDSSYRCVGVYNSEGNVRIKEGTIHITSTSKDSACFGIDNYEGLVEMLGGTINIISGDESHGINNGDSGGGGTVKISGGLINSTGRFRK